LGTYYPGRSVTSTLGYDLTTPDFWNRSLDIVERRVERLILKLAG